MNKIIHKIENNPGQLMIWCPGCDRAHGIYVADPDAKDRLSTAVWGFNEDYEKPTFTPSILAIYPIGEIGNQTIIRCHSFIKDGVWEFLSDCTHQLAGQKVPMVEF